MSRPDLVIPVRACATGGGYEELRHALRSWDALSDAEEVWLIGSKPSWAQEVNHIPWTQNQTKYQNTRKSLRIACENPLITDPFLWLNDDMFLLAPQRVDSLTMYHGGPLREYLQNRGRRDNYVRGGKETLRILADLGYDRPLNWGLHMPIYVSKAPMLEALNIAGNTPTAIHMRSLYGALSGLEGTKHVDVKIHGTGLPQKSWEWVSTSDISFRNRPVGRMIRERFSMPSRWES